MKTRTKVVLWLAVLWSIIGLLCWQSNAMAIESLLLGETTGGRFSGVAQYFAYGAEEGTAYETQQESQYSGVGTLPQMLIYQNSSGAIQREEQFVMRDGMLNTMSRVGTRTLVTFPDADDAAITHGVLTDTAAGMSADLIGADTTVHTLFQTAGGLVMRSEVTGEFISATIKYGAIQQVTTGYGPASGGEGDRFSSITGDFQEHYRFGAFNFRKPMLIPIGVAYSFSNNPAVSVLPVAVP